MSTGKILNITNGRTEEIEIPFENKETTNYRLTLKWDENKIDSKYAGRSLKHTIKLVATQKRS